MLSASFWPWEPSREFGGIVDEARTSPGMTLPLELPGLYPRFDRPPWLLRLCAVSLSQSELPGEPPVSCSGLPLASGLLPWPGTPRSPAGSLPLGRTRTPSPPPPGLPPGGTHSSDGSGGPSGPPLPPFPRAGRGLPEVSSFASPFVPPHVRRRRPGRGLARVRRRRGAGLAVEPGGELVAHGHARV